MKALHLIILLVACLLLAACSLQHHGAARADTGLPVTSATAAVHGDSSGSIRRI